MEAALEAAALETAVAKEAASSPTSAPVQQQARAVECIWHDTATMIEFPFDSTFAAVQSDIQQKLPGLAGAEERPVVFRRQNGAETQPIESEEQWRAFLSDVTSGLFVVPTDEQTQFDFSRLVSQLDAMSKVKPLAELEMEAAELESKDEDGDSQMDDVAGESATAVAGDETTVSLGVPPSSNRDRLPWGAGIGYGCSFDNSYWDMDSWRSDQTNYHATLTAVLHGINERLEKNDVDLSVIRQCCLVPFCIDQVSSSSIASMKLFQEFYKEVFSAIVWLCKNEETRPLVQEDVLVTSKSRANLWKSFSNLCKQASQAASLSLSAIDEADFVEDIIQLYGEGRSALGLPDEDAVEAGEAKEAMEQSYVEAMTSMRFDTVSMAFLSHKFTAELSGDLTNKKLIRRLAGEYADIAVSLPLTEESSIFVRVHETNMNLARFLVIPADETPYASGCFIFDIYFPGSYPDGPPKVNLATTGGGTVRFNPNLYNDGYVCLSLLGTWDAESEGEEWIPNISTFLQVVISVQSLIFVPDPYWNEPGFEANAQDPSEQANCQEYNKDKQMNTVRWAMIDQLLHPPPEFATAILRHFYLSKERVVRNAIMWLGEAHDLVVKLQCILEQLNENVWSDSPDTPTEPSPDQMDAFKARRNINTNVNPGIHGGDQDDHDGESDVEIEDAPMAAPVSVPLVVPEPPSGGGGDPMSVDPPHEEPVKDISTAASAPFPF